MSGMNRSLLQLDSVSSGYGHVGVLHDVSLEVREGEIVALIGPNNSGKTTLLSTICGLIKPTGGSITLGELDLTSLPVHEIVRRGVVLVPEGRALFREMTVGENLLMGGFRVVAKAERSKIVDQVYEIFPMLKERRRQKATTLSGGEQSMLALGRAMMAQPRILVVDEVSLGLAPMVIKRVYEVLQDLNRRGLALLVVEQNIKIALNVSHRAYLLLHGRVVLAGSSHELSKDPNVERAYLGQMQPGGM
jgi:branched-chain amino acid transport system ATP-binding protein